MTSLAWAELAVAQDDGDALDRTAGPGAVELG
jgi:hypothetical protein